MIHLSTLDKSCRIIIRFFYIRSIHTSHGKNFVGTFHQPRLVIADADLLASLPLRERRAGYAEIVKAALIGDRPLFDRLEAAGETALDGETLSEAVAAAVAFKARIVAEDEREAGARALLNLGHTFGHAFAAGLALAFGFSVHKGLCPAGDAERVRAHLRAAGLPDSPQTLAHAGWNAERLIDRMRDDKKNRDGRIALVLARGIGEAFIDRDTDETDLQRFVETQLS